MRTAVLAAGVIVGLLGCLGAEPSEEPLTPEPRCADGAAEPHCIVRGVAGDVVLEGAVVRCRRQYAVPRCDAVPTCVAGDEVSVDPPVCLRAEELPDPSTCSLSLWTGEETVCVDAEDRPCGDVCGS